MRSEPVRIGFVSTRLAGTDRVSLETEKWSEILTGLGHECIYFAGECDRPDERTYLVPEAHSKYPKIEALNSDLFENNTRSSETSGMIQSLRFHLKQHLYEFVRAFEVDLLIVENALSIPMNIPLGLALTEYIAETGIPTIAHNHDFSWERSHFSINKASDYLRAAFPPTLSAIHHVVINSFGSRQLALRTGASSTLIPNVMDFDNPPSGPDSYAADIRSSLGIGPDDYFLLQPTRIVPRKRIELAIEITRRLDKCSILVITHESGDEGSEYERYLRAHANSLGVRVVFGSHVVNQRRSQLPDGRKVFSLADAYQHADLVTYPSTNEGFGIAFLETIYYSRPIAVSTCEIFRTDIQPKGFRVIGFEDFITQETVHQARRMLEDTEIAAKMVEHNFSIGRRYYSYRTLENSLGRLLNECLGT